MMAGIPPNKMKKLFIKVIPDFDAITNSGRSSVSLLYLFTKSDANIKQKILFR